MTDPDIQEDDTSKDYENIPANEWDYDFDDLCVKFEAYIEDFFDYNKDEEVIENAKEWVANHKDEMDKAAIELAAKRIDGDKNVNFTIPQLLIQYTCTLDEEKDRDTIVELLKIVQCDFEWCEDDQCFYEDVICL